MRSVLESFGIDTRASPRLDDDAEAISETFAPLGTNETVNRFDELVLFGAPIDEDANLSGFSGGLSPAIDFDLNGTNVSASLLADPSTDTLPWFADGALRSATLADVDADGLDELLVAWQAEADAPVNLTVVQDTVTTGDSVVVTSGVPMRDLELVADDFDGDGTIDVAVALLDTAGNIEIVVLSNDAGVLSLSGRTFSIANNGDDVVQVAMTSGNVDRDAASELALVVNDFVGGNGFSNVTESSSRWFVLDDANAMLAQLAGDRSIIESADGPVVAKVADIALGDVDGDGVDEVVLGGLDQIGRQGDSNAPAPDYLIEVYDDAREDFASLASARVDADLPRSAGSGEVQFMYYLFVRTGDIDGDGRDEIVTNQYVWEDLFTSPGNLTALVDEVATSQLGEDADEPALAEIEQATLFSLDQRAYYFSAANVSFEVGDVTGDGRDDIAFWVERLNFQNRPQEVVVLGLSQEAGFREYVSVETEFQNPQRSRQAQLLLGDLEINGDTAALRLANGSYRYELTEPVVLAVLTAAPCSEELGQDLSSCRTGIGQSSTSGTSETAGVAFVANVSVGWSFEDPITSSGASVIARTRNELRSHTTNAYRTTISLLRETGPIEDTVVFTSVPYDIWSYEVISHPQPELVGRSIEVRLPREPIQLMTTRELYNSNSAPDAFKIDQRVLAHTPGDPGSYPSLSEKNALLQRFTGIESDLQTVGLNTGRQTVTIEQFEETTNGRAYSFRVTKDIQGSVSGVVGGIEYGVGADFDWSIIRGEGTLYQGQVAEIAPDNPITASYAFGLFAYYYVPDDANTPPFEVLNYWVEDF